MEGLYPTDRRLLDTFRSEELSRASRLCKVKLDADINLYRSY